MSKKIMSILLTFLFTCLTLSVSVSLDLTCKTRTFFSDRLSNHFQDLRRTFSEIFKKFDSVPLSVPSQNRIRPNTRLQIKRRKESARPNSRVEFCTLAPKICSYYYLPLHRATTTALQTAATSIEVSSF
jgi:hypothetical protein